MLLFLVIPRMTAYAFLCFTVYPPFNSVFVFLFHTTNTPFLIRLYFLYRKVFIYVFSSLYYVIVSSICGVSSCEMSVDVLLTDCLFIFW